MNLYIRADADSKIGTGHMMRCIALAQAWQDRGGTVTFISHCVNEALRERIQIEKFRLIYVNRVCADSADLTGTLSILKKERADQKSWFVLDGYHFTQEYQKAIRNEGYHLLVIDDMNHLAHYHADILLNQNIYAPDLTFKYHCDEDTKLLLGTRYVLLRREFLKYKNLERNIPERVRNILVTLGGADSDNITLKVIEEINIIHDSKIEVKIVIGPANPYRQLLSDTLASSRFASCLIINPPNMPNLMAWADLAISAGGSTCWELAYMRVPFLSIIIAENQRAIVNKLDIKKVTLNCDAGNDNTGKLRKILSTILYNREERSLMALNGSQLNDGNGTMRVYASMMD
jgi:UDP-2,4-diacetamido-2,4,6-trideoxy-beta-L-altropyranose hydrolase